MKRLPNEVESYKKTKVFNQDNIPKALLSDHKTLAGVWGIINVLEGELIYVISREPLERFILSKDLSGVVEPEQIHFVKPVGEVKFYVEFYK